MPTIYMILKVENESKTWEIYEFLHKFHQIVKADLGGGDIGVDVQDKGIFTLEHINGIPVLICKQFEGQNRHTP